MEDLINTDQKKADVKKEAPVAETKTEKKLEKLQEKKLT